jgi:two-component system OmpR family response regulator
MRILIADDNRDAADGLGMLLRMSGYEVYLAYDGESALRSACTHVPDCLLLDIRMPRMDGYSLARRIRELPALREAKLVAITAFSDGESLRRSQEAGFDHHLVKPVDPLELERLLKMLDQVMRLAGKTEELARLNVVLASETKELLEEVKEDIQEVKEEVKEIKNELRQREERCDRNGPPGSSAK